MLFTTYLLGYLSNVFNKLNAASKSSLQPTKICSNDLGILTNVFENVSNFDCIITVVKQQSCTYLGNKGDILLVILKLLC